MNAVTGATLVKDPGPDPLLDTDAPTAVFLRNYVSYNIIERIYCLVVRREYIKIKYVFPIIAVIYS